MSRYSGYVASHEVKSYCKKNNLFFVYKYITQYSNAYWSQSKYFILKRMLENLDTKGVNSFGERGYYAVSDLEKIDMKIKKQSFKAYNSPETETSISFRVFGKRESPKVFSCSEWTREYINKEDPLKIMRQRFSREQLHSLIVQAENTL